MIWVYAVSYPIRFLNLSSLSVENMSQSELCTHSTAAVKTVDKEGWSKKHSSTNASAQSAFSLSFATAVAAACYTL